VALLHLIQSMFEKPAAGLVSFGTYGFRRELLRPFVQAAVPAVLGYCCRFSTLLHEDCIRTLRFLAQQLHVADIVLEATWARLEPETRPFEYLVRLKCIQVLLYTWVAFTIPLPRDNTTLVPEMLRALKGWANAPTADVSGTALECLTLLNALVHGTPLAVTLEGTGRFKTPV